MPHEQIALKFPEGTKKQIKSLKLPGESLTTTILRALAFLEQVTAESQIDPARGDSGMGDWSPRIEALEARVSALEETEPKSAPSTAAGVEGKATQESAAIIGAHVLLSLDRIGVDDPNALDQLDRILAHAQGLRKKIAAYHDKISEGGSRRHAISRPERSGRRRSGRNREESGRGTAAPDRKGLLTRIRSMRDSGMSNRAIAEDLNRESLPTFSGKGKWQAGTIGNLLRQ